MSLSFSRASITEICQKCDHFAAFAGAFAKYLGEREGNLAKKRGDERKKCDSPCHVSLCGRGNELRALSIVAGYLANALFYLTNDTIGLGSDFCKLASRINWRGVLPHIFIAGETR
jgi:hypothetical protein